MWALFGKNVCKNERIGSCWGACAGGAPGSANAYVFLKSFVIAILLDHKQNQIRGRCLIMKKQRHSNCGDWEVATSVDFVINWTKHLELVSPASNR